MTEVLRPSLETAPGFTWGARLTDRPTANENGRTSAPRLVQAVVRQHAGCASHIGGPSGRPRSDQNTMAMAAAP